MKPYLWVLPPAKVISTVVLPHCQTVRGGACVCGRGCWAGGRGQAPDEVKLQVTNSHGTEVQCKHSAPAKVNKCKHTHSHIHALNMRLKTSRQLIIIIIIKQWFLTHDINPLIFNKKPFSLSQLIFVAGNPEKPNEGWDGPADRGWMKSWPRTAPACRPWLFQVTLQGWTLTNNGLIDHTYSRTQRGFEVKGETSGQERSK